MISSSSCSSNSISSNNYTRNGKPPSSPHTKTGKILKGGENGVVNRKALNQEKRITLQGDVEKLKKKLRHEENIHRAMERAFNRPLGALPRLPPFLPPPILELVAEVAVLEEEVARLEEQIVHCRQELYQEDSFTSSSSTNSSHMVVGKATSVSSNAKESESLLMREPLSASESWKGKENKLSANSTIKMPVKKMPIVHTQLNKSLETQKLQHESPTRLRKKCRAKVLRRLQNFKETIKIQHSRILNGICSSFRIRDIVGSYKKFTDVDAASINRNRTSSSLLFLIRHLKCILAKLSSVKLQKLNQQEKLGFWINIYNSCIMNGFLEHGIPESPEMVVTLMRKATINVGGHFLNAITIEHIILRIPYNSKYIYPKGTKKNEMAARSKFGLELSEPLVTFALSCGSWSSPAELETAKREYLEASVGISMAKMGIPKLMDWYCHDFAKDIESLLDWIAFSYILS